ncbi:MAG: RNA polymerase-associated protein RapA [Pseudomonadales bacterium]|nr:RNA polymerase-associated protein RapA [Pseudomonadales bacterium]
MQTFAVGQRWVSDSEAELGLGIVTDVTDRTVTVEFPGSGQQRQYAKDAAPLTRIRFQVGDEIRNQAQETFLVRAVIENADVLSYEVRPATKPRAPVTCLPESALSAVISLQQPLQRLLSGQIDLPQWYRLRYQTLQTLHFIEKSSLLGLCSARTELLPHQLYIAHEVAGRYAPRVLLADEVGLGKTIEAGMILQQQLFSGLASRVLLIVPESLVHQWLVEMRRRFNLAFSVFDEERCEAITRDSGDNPFQSEQLVLCSSDFFQARPQRHEEALMGEWDLLIVDEAHHLGNPAVSHDGKPGSGTPAYQQMEAFSQRVKGLILLTATPDQGGAHSQFALLRLLDPARFHDIDLFVSEQQTFIQLAVLVDRLLALDTHASRLFAEGAASCIADIKTLLQDDSLLPLLAHLQTADTRQARETARQVLVSSILDRHGTGRVLFRNSRSSVAGFPVRLLHAQALSCPAGYPADPRSITPETDKGNDSTWLSLDPRVGFVVDFVRRHQKTKILLICASRKTAIALEAFLRLRHGVRSSVFHEAMTLIERDRSAAYFADAQAGGQILLCSEIGSEGRNFQFSQHLILFDLPLNPDLLEQRIGRLDRIGQRQNIHLHVPYLSRTAQALLFRWYHEGLHAFSQVNNAGFLVYRELGEELQQLLGQDLSSVQTVNDFIDRSAELNARCQRQLAAGKDRLLEINSYNETLSRELMEDIQALEKSGSPEDFLTSLLATFGLEAEENSDGTWIVNPGEHMLVDAFPVVPDEGMSLSYQRAIALHREDIQFVTWHHPLVEQGIDLVLQGDYGKTSVSLLRSKGLSSAGILLEACYRISVHAPEKLQLKRFLPCTVIRVLIDGQGRNLSQALDFQTLDARLEAVDKARVLPLIAERSKQISTLCRQSEAIALAQLPAIIQRSTRQMLASLSDEIKRLLALRKVNPNVRDAEIDFLKKQVQGLHQAMQEASLQLEGLQVVFVVAAGV